ncbi:MULTISPECIES: DUF1826 domain-containing protein [unclassified Acinetobacter]|uniref:DUF1826 domain-containing protein n=1 Tax=unclassified Acinetobacter TaxID=196816 RepID=UPI0015D0FE55|nr:MULTISPECIES: DUF1826 domain-containing protein [unclassified Acinetobacter]
MSNPFSQHPQIGVVTTFSELIHSHFEGQMNALCWQRSLQGDFKEVVKKLELIENITEVSIDYLMELKLSAQGHLAREIILNDMQQLTAFGASPSLNLLKCYERDDQFDFISTDVYSFHVDRSPIATDTFLCTYYGASSDIVPNDQVTQKILIPEIREQLKALYDGPDSEFDDFLKEYFFDLHYQLKDNAVPVNLGNGYLWRLAVDHPTQPVLPCVHRAPVENAGEYRLMLIC